MGRRRKPKFRNPKMFSARVEFDDYLKFENILRSRDGKSLQEIMNIFVREYISGSVYLSGSKLEKDC